MRLSLRFSLILAFGAVIQPFALQAADSGQWVFCCRADNDLYRVATNHWPELLRVEDRDLAFQQAPRGAGVLVLADRYPEARTMITESNLALAAEKQLRVYVEYPAMLPDLKLGLPRGTEWERAVVSSDAFGSALPRLSILTIHGCQFVPVDAPSPLLVMARVAGFDKAAYGLPPTAYPVLFEHPNGRVLVATTKLSQFVTARYAPKEAWQAIWTKVLGWLQPAATIPALDWTPTVRPTYDRQAALPADALPRAIIRGIDWHTHARMLMHPSWTNEYAKYGNLANPIGPRPNPAWPSGDGECGLLEGFNSRVFPDGGQNIRWWLRTDAIGESALAFALRSRIDGDRRSERIGSNLVDWVYFNSKLLHDDPRNPNFGLLGWAPNVPGTYYQDNDIKAILGCIGTSALLHTDRWDEALLKNILGNFRTTGIYGFRGENLNDNAIQQHGWQYYWRLPKLHYSAHFEAWIWASYLWLYDKTHFAPLLERSKTAISRMLAAYPDKWQWTNGIQQERGRMLLTLAWLVRVEDTPEHRGWLKRIATDMLADQVASGAIREAMGEFSLGYMRPPQSNEAYGTGEAPLIHKNGDPVADLLYTCNFALLGLHEAAAATGDPQYQAAEDKLIQFLLRVQVKSEAHPELDGAWFRAFDFNRWDYFASNSDWGWGAWAVECGWTQGWINTGLALNYLKLNLWDLSKASRIGTLMARIQPLMLPSDQIAVPPAERRVDHWAVGKPVVSLTPPDSRYPGPGSAELTDGITGLTDYQATRWLGYEGLNCEAVVDMGKTVAVRNVAVNCLQQTSVGIYFPVRAEFAISTDGTNFVALPAASNPINAAEPGPSSKLIGRADLNASGRFIKVRVVNAEQIPSGQPGAGAKSWLFIDEILVNQGLKE